MPNYNYEYGANPKTAAIYGEEKFDHVEQIISNPGENSYYVDSKMGDYARDYSTLVILNETGAANEVKLRKESENGAGFVPHDVLEFDLSLIPANAEFDLRQVSVANKKGAISKDLVIDIFVPEANSRKSIVIKGQLDEDPRKNGNGVEVIQFSAGPNGTPANATTIGFSTGETIPTKPNPGFLDFRYGKIEFESIKAEFDRHIIEYGGKLRNPNISGVNDNSMGEAAKLAQKAFVPQSDGAVTIDPSQGGKLKTQELVPTP